MERCQGGLHVTPTTASRAGFLLVESCVCYQGPFQGPRQLTTVRRVLGLASHMTLQDGSRLHPPCSLAPCFMFDSMDDALD